MAIVSFQDFTPIEREDGIPFLFVDIYESPPVEPKVWTKIDEKDLASIGGIDMDPAHPMSRSFTTTLATLDADGSYYLAWRDAFGNTSETEPIYAARYPGVPSAAVIRARMPRIEWTEMGYGMAVPDPLDPVILETVAEFRTITGADPTELITGNPTTVLAAKTLRFMVAFNCNRETQEILESTTDFDILGSLSQGPASETRRQMNSGRSMVHPSPVIDRMLRDFMKATAAGVASLESVPGVRQGPGRLPRPGSFVMDDLSRSKYPTASVYGVMPTLGVAVYLV